MKYVHQTIWFLACPHCQINKPNQTYFLSKKAWLHFSIQINVLICLPYKPPYTPDNPVQFYLLRTWSKALPHLGSWPKLSVFCCLQILTQELRILKWFLYRVNQTNRGFTPRGKDWKIHARWKPRLSVCQRGKKQFVNEKVGKENQPQVLSGNQFQESKYGHWPAEYH